MDLVLYHHNHTKSNYPDLCSILKKADHHSASEREDIDDTQEVNKTPLISLFSKIVLEGNGKVDEQYIPLNKLSLDDGSFNNLKPAAKKDTMGGWNLVPEYKNLWDEFNSEFELIQNKTDFNTLLALLKKYASTMPSAAYKSKSDISLYDHSKTTAALAVSRYLFNRDGDVKLTQKDDLNCYLAIEGDISGIQKFIFKISSPQEAQSGMSKRLRGRSLYLTLLCDAIATYIAEELELCEANILFCGGGRFTIIGPNTQIAKEKLAEIKSNLTGNKDNDKDYIINQFKVFNSKEIHLELGRLLWDLMSDEEQKEYKKAVIQDIPVDEFIKSVYSYLNYGDFETALKELEDYMEIIPFKFRENPQFDYFYFNNPLEEELFRKYFKTPKELKVIPFGEEYPRVFYLYGVVLMNLSEFDRAESALKKALSYNPVSGEILSTLSALYDGNYDLNNLKKTAVEILKFSYDPREIAKAYRDLGYCYYENKKCNISKALYEQSLNYENHPRAQIELQLINSYLHIDETDIKKVLNDENIPTNINDDILEISMFLALDFEKKNLLNQSLYFYGVLYNLTHDEEVLTKINDLKHRL